VHDQGRGHLNRLIATVAHLDEPVICATAHPQAAAALRAVGVEVVRLPPDVAAHASHGPAPFPHVPIDPFSADRSGALLDVSRSHECSTAVIDLSAEVAVLCRLAGLRVVTVREAGRRDDAPHRLGFSSADVVWSPTHADLEPAGAPVPSSVFHSGGFSRFDLEELGRCEARRRLGLDDRGRVVLLMVGGGGNGLDDRAWRRCTSDLGASVVIAGLGDRWRCGSVTSLGMVADPFNWLAAADVVVTSGGWASVYDAVAANTPFAAVAEERPFGEQALRVGSLASRGLCIGLDSWLLPEDLGGVVERALELDAAAWDPFHDRKGAKRAAQMIQGVHHG